MGQYLNNGIENIEYNVLNLPKLITVCKRWYYPIHVQCHRQEAKGGIPEGEKRGAKLS